MNNSLLSYLNTLLEIDEKTIMFVNERDLFKIFSKHYNFIYFVSIEIIEIYFMVKC